MVQQNDNKQIYTIADIITGSELGLQCLQNYSFYSLNNIWTYLLSFIRYHFLFKQNLWILILTIRTYHLQIASALTNIADILEQAIGATKIFNVEAVVEGRAFTNAVENRKRRPTPRSLQKPKQVESTTFQQQW